MTVILVAGLILGLAVLKNGRGPVHLLMLALLHVEAGIMCGRLALKAALHTFKERYEECLGYARRRLTK